MKRMLCAVLMSIVAGAATAQPAPPPGPPPGPPPASPPGPPPAPPPGRPPGPGRDDLRPPPPRGAHIKIDRDDISVSVRCAEGETTKACGEIVAQLLEKMPAAPAAAPERRGERTGERGYREPERGRGGFRDRERDERGAD